VGYSFWFGGKRYNIERDEDEVVEDEGLEDEEDEEEEEEEDGKKEGKKMKTCYLYSAFVPLRQFYIVAVESGQTRIISFKTSRRPYQLYSIINVPLNMIVFYS